MSSEKYHINKEISNRTFRLILMWLDEYKEKNNFSKEESAAFDEQIFKNLPAKYTKEYLLNYRKWSGLRELGIPLFKNVHKAIGDPTSSLFREIGRNLHRFDAAGLIDKVSEKVTVKKAIREIPSYNEKYFNKDQIIELIKLEKRGEFKGLIKYNAVLISYFKDEFINDIIWDQCELTQGYFESIPKNVQLPEMRLKEKMCGFDLERVLKQDLSYLNLDVQKTEKGILVNGKLYAKPIIFNVKEINKKIKFNNKTNMHPKLLINPESYNPIESIDPDRIDEFNPRKNPTSGFITLDNLMYEDKIVMPKNKIFGSYCFYNLEFFDRPVLKHITYLIKSQKLINLQTKNSLQKEIEEYQKVQVELWETNEQLKKRNTELDKTNKQLLMAYSRHLDSITKAVELRDSTTQGHCLRTSLLTEELIKAANKYYPELEIDAPVAITAALIHDSGKIGTRDAILNKQGKLTQEEREHIQQHAIETRNLLKGSDFLEDIAYIGSCHQECYDGSGYPYKLKGEDIPIEGRVLKLADVWDALTNRRPYRDATSIEETFKFIVEHNITKEFDPKLYDAFKKISRKRLDEILNYDKNGTKINTSEIYYKNLVNVFESRSRKTQ